MDRMFLLLPLIWMMGAHGSLQRLVYKSDDRKWTEAQTYCRKYHTDLATIRTDEDNNNIVQDSWLGLYREDTNSDWKWSRGDEALTYAIVWDGNDPDAGENCVYKQQDDNGEWRTKDCDESRKFYCFEELVYLVKEKKTWEEALKYCRAKEVLNPTAYKNHTYDLVSLLTLGDHDIAKEMMQTAETEEVWIGLRFLGDRWMWVDQGQVQNSGIDGCDAVKRCGALGKTSSGQVYSTRDCAERKNFLCYKRPAAR